MRSSTLSKVDFGKPGSREVNRPVFSELEFMRLANAWQSCRRTTTLHGTACAGKIFKRYETVGAPLVWLDFVYRGYGMSDRAAHAFTQSLSSLHVVNEKELLQLTELLGPCLGGIGQEGFVQMIEHAEVGAVNGRMVLAVYWTHRKSARRVISIFIDANGDGKIAHEIHFSAPPEQYESYQQTFNETMRSVQWRLCAPPMVGSVA